VNATPSAYPLAWPASKPRTPYHRRTRAKFRSGKGAWTSDSFGNSRYESAKALTVAGARERVLKELDRIDARYAVLSTNLETRLDGLPRSGQRMPDDPGVALYFQLKAKPIVLACDRYDRVEDNIAAIAAHIDAMRTAERHGVGSFEEMFAGFTALPPAMAPDDWRAVLGEPKSLAEAESTYREKMKTAHPDVGGTNAAAAALNAAIEMARQVLAKE
jgi:hypothetical protein